MKNTILAIPIIISSSFNGAAAQSTDELVHADILDSYASHSDVVVPVRFYNSQEDYEVHPVFNNVDEDEASAVLPRNNGKSWAIESYSIVGDDYFQMRTGGFFEGIGTIHLETPAFCTADGLATVSLRARVRPSMSDLAKGEENLSDIEFILSNIFSHHTNQVLNSIEYTDDFLATYEERVLYPALTNAAAEFEARYGITVAENPDLIVSRGITRGNLSNLPPQDRERVCPNPTIRL